MRTMKHLMGCVLLASASENEPSELNFMAMGDWGGQEEESPYATGDEESTAFAMNNYARSTGAKFALALGDNFYSHGVTSVNDSRFKDTFEECFAGDHLSSSSGFKFQVLAGNHDHYGNVQAQIDYSQHSARWNFPSLWYSFTETAPDGATVEFVMIDTITITGNSQGPDDNLKGSELPGPVNLSAANSQVDWLKKTLKASTADYLVLSGHHPVYSIMEHGPTSRLSPSRFLSFGDNKVSAYLSGHDHGAQHIDVGDGVQYHVIGAAHGGDSSTKHQDTIEKSQLKYHSGAGGGFAAFSVTKSGMTISHLDKSGNVQYTAPVIKPRGSYYNSTLV